MVVYKTLDRHELRRLRAYIIEAEANLDVLSEYEQRFVKDQSVMFAALAGMMSLTMNQWELWFQIINKIRGE